MLMTHQKTRSVNYVSADDIKASIDCRDIARRYDMKLKTTTPKYDLYFAPPQLRDDGISASFVVFEDGFKDFGGDSTSGDVISFVELMENCSFQEACNILKPGSGFMNTPLSRKGHTTSYRTKQIAPPSQAWQDALSAFCDNAHTRLMQTPAQLKYLHDRGLSDETIRQFNLGYNPKWCELDYRHEGQRIKIAPGIIIPWVADDTLFAIRVRTFEDYLDKYLSVRGSKPSIGLFNADSISAGQPLYMVEGEFDAMLLTQVSNESVVTRGSAGDCSRIPERWLSRLKVTSQVYTLFDGDNAGMKATEKLATILPITPLTLPAGNDVTEFMIDHAGQWADVNHDVPVIHTPALPESIDDDLATPPPPAPIDDDWLMWASEQNMGYETEGYLPASHTDAVPAFPDFVDAPADNSVMPPPIDDNYLDYLRDNIRAALPDDDSPALTIESLLPLTRAYERNVQFVSEMLDVLSCHTSAIRSPMATGKTHAVNLYTLELLKINPAARTLHITPRAALNADVARRKNDIGIPAENAVEIWDKSRIKSVQHLVITPDSIHHVDIATYDFVILDESEQILAHIASAGTMKDAAADNFEIMTRIIHTAGRVCATDAHLTDLTINYLRATRNHCHTVINTYRPEDARPVTRHSSKYAIIADALQCVLDNPNNTTAITCNTRKEVCQIRHYFSQHIDPDLILALHGRNTSNAQIQNIIRDLDSHIQKYRVVITSPAIGTGIDIQTRVAGVFGIFHTEPTTPAQMLQQFGRFRHADYRAIWVSSANKNLETNPDRIYDRLMSQVHETAKRSDVRWKSAAEKRRIEDHARLRASIQAQYNIQKQSPADSFYTIAAYEGYEIVEKDDNSSDIFADSQEAYIELEYPLSNAELREEDKQATLTLDALSNKNLEEMERSGTVIEDDYFRNDRYNIEQDTGWQIHDRIYDTYYQKAKRRHLRLWRDWRYTITTLKDHDRAENSTLLHRRGNYAYTHEIIAQKFLGSVLTAWGATGEFELTREVLEAIIAAAQKPIAEDMYRLEARKDLSKNLIPTLRRWLPPEALKSGKRTIDGVRVRVYWLNHDALKAFFTDTEVSQQHREAIAQNADKVMLLRELDNYSDNTLIAAGLTPVSDPIALLCEICGVSGVLSSP